MSYSFTPREEALLSMRSAIRRAIPALRAAHVAEALARSLGFRNNAALCAWMAIAPSSCRRDASAEVFLARMGELEAEAITSLTEADIMEVYDAAARDASAREAFVLLLQQAVEAGASDIWVPAASDPVRFRIDGAMQDAAAPSNICAVFALAQELATEKGGRHDDARLPGFPLELAAVRVWPSSACGGQMSILRLLYRERSGAPSERLERLGYSPEQAGTVR